MFYWLSLAQLSPLLFELFTYYVCLPLQIMSISYSHYLKSASIYLMSTPYMMSVCLPPPYMMSVHFFPPYVVVCPLSYDVNTLLHDVCPSPMNYICSPYMMSVLLT